MSASLIPAPSSFTVTAAPSTFRLTSLPPSECWIALQSTARSTCSSHSWFAWTRAPRPSTLRVSFALSASGFMRSAASLATPFREVLDHHKHPTLVIVERGHVLQLDPEEVLPLAHQELGAFPLFRAAISRLGQIEVLPWVRYFFE